MTQQEIFDGVARHLLTQMEKSADKSACLYRGPNGLKCAVGGILPDELYNPDMESGNCGIISAVFQTFPKVQEYFGKENIALLSRLQGLHDGNQPHYWKDLLLIAAGEFNLNHDVLKEF